MPLRKRCPVASLISADLQCRSLPSEGIEPARSAHYGPGMELKIKKTYEHPASLLWQAIGEEFARVADWAPGLEDSYIEGDLKVGCTRVCHAEARWPFPQAAYRETLLEFDRRSMSLMYRAVEGLPKFMVHEGSYWTVVPEGPGRCHIRVVGILRIRGVMALLSPWMRWQLGRVTADMCRRLERQVDAIAAGRRVDGGES